MSRARPSTVLTTELATQSTPSRVQEDPDGNLSVYLTGDFVEALRSSVVLPVHEYISSLTKLSDPRITVHVSSNGGLTMVCWDIIEALERAMRNGITVRTVVTSHAYSAGSMTAIVASEGERYIGRRATHVIHYGFSGAHWSTPLQVEREAAWARRHFKNVLEHYKAYADVPGIETLIEDDSLWYGARDCIKHGLADRYTDELDD